MVCKSSGFLIGRGGAVLLCC